MEYLFFRESYQVKSSNLYENDFTRYDVFKINSTNHSVLTKVYLSMKLIHLNHEEVSLVRVNN